MALMWLIWILTGKNAGITRRTLAKYRCDGLGKGRNLDKTNELVHLSVRIRYMYGGFDLDDKGLWKMHGYELMPRSFEEDVSPECPPGLHLSAVD
jgi:hypothetical protein